MVARVAVVGVTSWGLVLADLFGRAGASVSVLARNAGEVHTVVNYGTDPRRIPELRLPASIAVTADAVAALGNAEIVVLAVPAQSMRRNLGHVLPALPSGAVLVSAAKGIELDTGLRMTQVLAAGVPDTMPCCALSGPNLAAEIARGQVAATVVAGAPAAARRVQEALSSPSFRVYTHDDVVGVELGGALKNTIALAAGIGDGLDAGNNAKAALITRGLAEITRLGVALGASPLTFAGLSGLGDIVATCASPLSRNRRVGEDLGRGRPLAAILDDLGHVAEGVTTTDATCRLARSRGVELPIAFAMAEVIAGRLDATDATQMLMEREPTHEQHP